MSQSRWKGQFRKQNKFAKSANFVSKFEESQNCFERKVGEGFGFIGLNFFIEQLRRGCCTCKVSFLTPTAFSSKIGLLKLVLKSTLKA